MQTSKTYGTPVNVEIKLELDDLEYVYADGQNLIINPDASAEHTDNENIVYADGSQAVVLQNGVKHFIQTIGGETYLVGNDAENIQQLVINADDQSEESSNAVECMQGNENLETVIYKFAEDESDVNESEIQAKRFKIGDTEYVTLTDEQNLHLSENDQFSILDENNIAENGNFQYAILKDGKLHLQLCEGNSVEVLNHASEEQIGNTEQGVQETVLEENQQEYVADKEKVQEYVLVNSEFPQDPANLSHFMGKDLITGKTITLDDYLERMQYKVGQIENVKEEKSKNSNLPHHNQYLNKKLLIRRNANGRSLFGKILHIQPAKKAEDEQIQKVEIQDGESNETIVLNIETEGSDENLRLVDDDEDTMQEFIGEDSESLEGVGDASEMAYNREVTEEQINFLSKILNGLADMPSLKKKLMEHKLEIKLVEKQYNLETQEMIRDVRFITGCLLQQDNGFVLDDSDDHKNVISLTVVVDDDGGNQKTTKVTFHEKPATCETCNKDFQSLNLLNRHVQIYHTDRTTCNICQLKFPNHVFLMDHRKANGHYFVCETCNKRFTTQSSLKRHQSIHSHVKAYQCGSCGKAFMTLNYLNLHKKIHNPIQTCYCEICGREFSRHSNLLRHTEIHKGNGDLYKCGICDCSYRFISSLTRHIVQNHMKQAI